MSRPEESHQDEIFERLRRGEINLKQAYKLLERLEGGQPIEALTPRRASRFSALWAFFRPREAERPPLRAVKTPAEEAAVQPKPVSRLLKFALELSTIGLFLAVVAALAVPLLAVKGYAPGFDVPSHMYVTQRLAEGLKTAGRLPTIDPSWYSGLEITHKLPPLAYIPMIGVYLLTGSAMLTSRIIYVLALGTMGLIMYGVVRLSGGGRLNGLGAAIVVPFSMASVSYDNGVLLSYTRYFAFLLFPFALYSAKRLVEGRLIHTVILAVIISLMFPSHPMIGLIAAMWIGVYALARIVLERRAILSFRYFVYAYALSAFMAFWYIGPFVAEEPVWGTAIPHQTLVENSTPILWQAVHFEIALAVLVVAALIFRFSMERLALAIAAGFGFAYAWGAYGPILKVFPQLQFAYPFLAFFASVIGLTYMVFTSANLADIKGAGQNLKLKQAGATVLVMLLVAGVVYQNWRHQPFTRYKVSNFSGDELGVANRLRRDPVGGRVMPLSQSYGLMVHAIPLKGRKPTPEGQYTTIAPFYLEISQIYDNLLNGYPDAALEKLKRWNTNYVLLDPMLKQKKDFKNRDMKQLLVRNGFSLAYSNPSWTLYKNTKPTGTIQGIPGNTMVIGRFAPVVLSLFPSAIAAQKSLYVDDYSLSELKSFKTLVLTGFSFKNKEATERLLKAYIRRGGKAVIDMQGVDEALLGKDGKFLGVKVEQTKLSGKTGWKVTPAAGVDPATLKPTVFPPNWRTVSYTDLTKTLWLAKNGGRRLALLGEKKIGPGQAFFIGGNLAFFAFDRHDAGMGGAVQKLFNNLEVKKPPGSIKFKVRRSSPEKVVFDYRAATAWPILISRTFTPHWRAVVDSRTALTPIKLEGLTGLDLPKGNHTVSLYYGRTSIHPLAYAVTAPAWLLAAGLFVWYRRRDSTPSGPRPD